MIENSVCFALINSKMIFVKQASTKPLCMCEAFRYVIQPKFIDV